MKYTSTLIAVKDIEKSKQFYYDVLGLDVISDFGANVTLAGGIALQTIDTWKDFIHKRSNEVVFQNNAVELYFEEDDIDTFISKIKLPVFQLVASLQHVWSTSSVLPMALPTEVANGMTVLPPKS